MAKSFRQFVTEEKVPSVVITFGRFNPPTSGHEKLIEKVADVARKYRAETYRIYASHSSGTAKNPLEYREKISFMRRLFPRHGREIVISKARNILEILTDIHKTMPHIGRVIIVVGSDRIEEFRKLTTKYNGIAAAHGKYSFSEIVIESAGHRDPDAEGVTGMSASKMRDAAINNDFDTFKKGLPRGTAMGNALELFEVLQKRLNIKFSEERHIELPAISELREAYVRKEIFLVGDIVEEKQNSKNRFKISYRGPNFIRDEKGKSYFIHSVKPINDENV